jgi:hypothetical protein
MYVKVFVVEGRDNIESTIQRWLNTNPRLKIEGMSQSSVLGTSDKNWHYVITIIYSV